MRTEGALAALPAADTSLTTGNLAALRMSAVHAPQDEKTLRQVARQFEALLTQQVLKSARAASLSDEPAGGAGLDLAKDMFDQQMAQQISAGKGLGLADVLVRQLKFSSGAATSAVAPTAPTASNPAPGAVSDSEQSFVNRIWSAAQSAAQRLGVATETVVGHAALETGWGAHRPGGDSANLFGIKAGSGWKGDVVTAATNEMERGSAVRTEARFRSYQSVEQGLDDYVSFLKDNPRYAAALKAGTQTAEGFASGLQKAGYATDPHYADKLVATIARVRRVRASGAGTA
jgi:peptidoglycan hydrolase FlgJ